MSTPGGLHYGFGLAEATGDLPGSVYPVLRRMLDAGWLTDRWEVGGPEGRPPRRYYELTDVGRGEIVELLRAVVDDPRWRPWLSDEVRANLGPEVRRVRDREP